MIWIYFILFNLFNLGTNTSLMLGSGSTLFAQQKPGGLFGNTGNNATFNTAGTFGSSTFGTNTNVGTGIGTGLLGAGYYIKFFTFDFYHIYIYLEID